MEVILTKDSKELNGFAARWPGSQFLQSGYWAEFQSSLKRPVWQYLVKDQDKVISSMAVVKYPLPFSQCYLYLPRGPLVLKDNQEAYESLLNKLKELAKKEKAVFIKIEPVSKDQSLANFLKVKGFKKTRTVQPANTLMLDLSLSLEKLMAGFHQKTRYNIRLAEKKGVKVKISTSEADLEVFWQLVKETATRDKFNSHPKEYYLSLIKELAKDNLLQIFLAEYNGKVLAANLNIFFGDTAVYLHGASSDENRNLMAPYLLQWQAITQAKKLGFKYYDFWGIAPEGAKDHPWAGVTRFKLGFGGQRIDYLGAWDWPIKKLWYNLYRLVRLVKRFR